MMIIIDMNSNSNYLVIAFDFSDIERFGGPVARDFDLLLLVEPDELGGGRLDEILQHLQIRQTLVALRHQFVETFAHGRHVLVVDRRFLSVELALQTKTKLKKKKFK